MKAKTFLAIAFLCGSFGLAQAETGISVGGNLNLPMSDLGDAAGIGFGLSPGFSYSINERYDIIGGLGLNVFGGQGDFDVTFLAVPISAGIRFKIEDAVAYKTVFMEAKGGVVYRSVRSEFGNSSKTGAFLGIGAGIMLSDQIGVATAYNVGADQWHWVGLKGFYQFGGY